MYDGPGRDVGPKTRDCWKDPPLAIQGTMGALWTALEVSRHQAIELANLFTRIGSAAEAFRAGQQRFASGKLPKWRLR